MRAPPVAVKHRKGTFWSIAAKEYGDGSLATKLSDYNKAAAPDAARLTLGEILKPHIPEVGLLQDISQ